MLDFIKKHPASSLAFLMVILTLVAILVGPLLLGGRGGDEGSSKMPPPEVQMVFISAATLIFITLFLMRFGFFLNSAKRGITKKIDDALETYQKSLSSITAVKEQAPPDSFSPLEKKEVQVAETLSPPEMTPAQEMSPTPETQPAPGNASTSSKRSCFTQFPGNGRGTGSLQV